jgi:hypothetical protein
MGGLVYATGFASLGYRPRNGRSGVIKRGVEADFQSVCVKTRTHCLVTTKFSALHDESAR